MLPSSIPVCLKERLDKFGNADRLVVEIVNTGVLECNVDCMSDICESDFPGCLQKLEVVGGDL